MKTKTDPKPNGSRVQRQKRKLAEAREAVVVAMTYGRDKATTVLLNRARDRALPMRMPAVRTRRGLGDRIRDAVINVAARIVAAKISHDTWKVVLERQKLSFENFVAAMQTGPALSRMARN